MHDPLLFLKDKTPSGVTVYCQHRPELPWEALQVVVHAGQRHDPPDRPGTAHLLEHLVAMGSEGYPRKDPQDLYRWATEQGFDMQWGLTGPEGTMYGGRTALRNVERFIGYLHSMVLLPDLRSDIEHERDIIRDERTEGGHRRVRDAQRIHGKAVFGDHPLSRMSVIPEDDILDSTTYDDVRRFHDTHYACPNMTIVAVGGMETESLLYLLDATFKDRPGRIWTPPPPQPPPAFGRIPVPQRHHCPAAEKRPESVDLELSWTKPKSRHRSEELLLVRAIDMLLHERVREQERAAYSIDVDHWRMRDCTYIGVSTITPIAKAEKARLAIIETLKDDAALAAAVPRVQKEIILDTELADDTVDDIIDVVCERVLAGDPIEPMRDILAQYAGFTPEALVAMRREHLGADRAFTLSICE